VGVARLDLVVRQIASKLATMAEITARRQGEMIQTLFQILEGEPEGLQAKEAIARVEGELQLTEFEKSTFPRNPDLVRFPKILRFRPSSR